VLEALRALYDGRIDLPADHRLADAPSHDRNRRIRVGDIAMEVGERWGWNEDRGNFLTREQAQLCLDIYRQEAARFEARFPGMIPPVFDLEARGFQPRAALPDVSQIAADTLRAFYDKVGAAMVTRSPANKVKGDAGPGTSAHAA
jgi:hypothetical protein